MSFEQAIELLQKTVKESNVKNQKHIDLTLVDALERPRYEKALAVVQSAILRGEHNREEVLHKIGLF